MTYQKIIWISLDTLRADCINFNKAKLYPKEYDTKTKLRNSKLDEVCSKGFFFNNTISAAPYTSTSHASYFTGMWPKNHGVYDQFNSKLKAKTIFQIAKKAGYKTMFKTDFPFILGKYLNMIKGVDKYYIEDNKKPLEDLMKNKKVFTFLHFGQIHYPYGFHNLKFGGRDYINKVKSLEKKYGLKSKKINLEDMAIETFRTKKDLSLLYKYKKIIAYLYSNKKDNDLFNLYLEGINYFHKNFFNNFLEKLIQIVENENCLLIISSDHGEAWNDQTYGHHNSLDEGVIRVPLIFYAKNIKPKVYSNRIRTIDVAPTINKIIFKENAEFDGKTLHKIIYNGKMEPDRPAFSAVWVNESKEVLKKIKTLLDKDKFSAKKNNGVKYGVTMYNQKYKYLIYYKKFVNRSEQLAECISKKLYKINSLTNFKETKNQAKMKKLDELANKYNKLKTQKRNSQTRLMKKYFNLMGYKI